MSTIKHIIFDLGGVILNINYQLTIDAFNKLGFVHFEKFYTQKNQISLFDAFEIGKISPHDFRTSLKKNCQTPLSDANIDAAWNAMLLDLPENRLRFIESLKNNYSVFLLSNTNKIHITAFKNIINKNIGYNRFKSAFNDCFYSSEIGLKKPDPNCFLHVLKKYNLNKEETLFIDDSPQHITGAMHLGLMTYFLKSGEEIVKVLPDIIR